MCGQYHLLDHFHCRHKRAPEGSVGCVALRQLPKGNNAVLEEAGHVLLHTLLQTGRSLSLVALI
jgi:hypothetical protein